MYFMEWKQILDTADEDYLVGISNKGIVKRAYKDKDECAQTPMITFPDEGKELSVPAGGEMVKLCYPLGESKCSCPSRSICRHVILAILYAKEQVQNVVNMVENPAIGNNTEGTDEGNVQKDEMQQGTKESAQIIENLWEEILAYPRKKLLRTLGLRGISTLVNHMERQVLPKIQQTSIITVKLPEENYVVKLLSPLEYATCTCHKKELCIHKAEAILWCQWQEKQLTLEELKEQFEQAPEFDKEQIREVSGQIKKYLEELLQMGLCRSSVEVVNALERLAILAHNASLARIESSLRGLAEVYNKYGKRSASFSVVEAKRKLMRLYKKVCKLYETNKNSEISELAGEFHAEYKPVGNLDLVGITLEHFVSQSGYEGDTVYFLEEHTGQWYTYTNARPTFYDNKRRSGYTEKAQSPWGISVSLEGLVNKKIHLRNAKADVTGRLSSTQETEGEILESRQLTEELLEKWYYRDFGEAFREQIEISYEEETDSYRKPQKLVLLQPTRREDGVFDQVEQVLHMSLYDEEDRKVLVEVAYSEREKNTIHYLERLKNNSIPCFVGRLYLKGSEMRMYPLDLFEEKELPWSKEEKKSWLGFDWKKTIKVEEREADTVSQDRVIELLEDVELLLGDLYQVGFSTVQDAVLQNMQSLSEQAMVFGMNGLAQELIQLEKQLAHKRHQMKQSEEMEDMLMRRYLKLCDYVSLGQKKVMYDKAKICYDIMSASELEQA